MAREFSMTPTPVPAVETKFRRIVTELPAPQSIETLRTLHHYELRAMQGQPPVVWDHAEGFQVYDAYGNCWIDWSSGVLITNAGHSHPKIVEAIRRQVEHKLLTTYIFANEPRARFVKRFAELLPETLRKIFLVTTGSEAVECAIKLCRTH